VGLRQQNQFDSGYLPRPRLDLGIKGVPKPNIGRSAHAISFLNDLLIY